MLLKRREKQAIKEKNNPFECGFDPNHKMRAAFSLRFFILTIIFLIFDVEVASILPIPLGNLTSFLNMFI
jgi:NADH:ubiquinone oxidoreductase subunit 3 (subunit A)